MGQAIATAPELATSTVAYVPFLDITIEGEETSPVQACSVAKVIVEQGLPNLSLTKIIKLVYLAHAWHLGLLKKPLFLEPVEAWKNGPAIDSVYEALKHTSSKYHRPALDKLREVLADFPRIEHDSFEANLIAVVTEHYGKYDEKKLNELTQTYDSPWSVAIDICEVDISNELIQNYYQGKLQIND